MPQRLFAFIFAVIWLSLHLATADNHKILLQDFDALGAWFDGVAAIDASTSPGQTKNSTIAIVGAGISGLATALMLDSVGVHNWELIEARDEIGGRFRTVHVGGTEEWADLGPMRLPYKARYKEDNEIVEYTETAMVFQLAAWLNSMNMGDHEDLIIDFIPFIQHSPNELLALETGRHPDGSIPTRADIAGKPSLGVPPPLSTQEYNDTKEKMDDIVRNMDTVKRIQRDVWREHRRVMDEGLDEISQQGMMRNVWKASINVTDALRTSTEFDVFWDEMHQNSNLFLDKNPSAAVETEWKCVDGGFSRLAQAILPHVKDRFTLNRQVRKVEAIEGYKGKTTGTQVSWVDVSKRWPETKPRPDQTKSYDYTILAAPFTMTRMMTLPPFSSVLSRAISERGLRFGEACKVALLFSERFWEKGERPIFGGHSTAPDPAIGELYYPVYGLNETGRPGVIMSYQGGDWGSRLASLSDDEHVGIVLDAIASLHGEEVRDFYKGYYERLCWIQEPFIATSWCRPDVEQHKLYIPSYHRTEHNTIFVGEHTAPTHAWTSSALHSAVRGSVQLLLELELIDEAKELNQRWMGRWIQK